MPQPPVALSWFQAGVQKAEGQRAEAGGQVAIPVKKERSTNANVEVKREIQAPVQAVKKELAPAAGPAQAQPAAGPAQAAQKVIVKQEVQAKAPPPPAPAKQAAAVVKKELVAVAKAKQDPAAVETGQADAPKQERKRGPAAQEEAEPALPAAPARRKRQQIPEDMPLVAAEQVPPPPAPVKKAPAPKKEDVQEATPGPPPAARGARPRRQAPEDSLLAEAPAKRAKGSKRLEEALVAEAETQPMRSARAQPVRRLRVAAPPVPPAGGVDVAALAQLVPANLCPEALDAKCCVCKSGNTCDTNDIALCDQCNKPYHQQCHDPKVEFFGHPDDQWFCAACTEELSRMRDLKLRAGNFAWASVPADAAPWPAKVVKIDFTSLADPRPYWVQFFDTGPLLGAWVGENQVTPWAEGPTVLKSGDARKRLAVRLAEANGAPALFLGKSGHGSRPEQGRAGKRTSAGNRASISQSQVQGTRRSARLQRIAESQAASDEELLLPPEA